MNCFHRNIFFALLFFSLSVVVSAQEVDTISTVTIDSIYQPDATTIEFDLMLTRNSDSWSVFGNGTYQITIGGNFTFDPLNQTLQYRAMSSILPPSTFSQPMKGYLILTDVLPGRLNISILGPDEYSDGVVIPKDRAVSLGKFIFKDNKGRKFPSPAFISWFKLYSKYQAHAFKKEIDSISTGALWYGSNDNVEMNNYTTSVRYVVNNPKIQPTNDIDLLAVYRGSGRVELTWRTTSEYYNRGFVLRRGLRSSEDMPLTFDTEVGDYLKGVKNPILPDAALISKSVKGGGAEYSFFDTVPERGVQYVYELTDVSSAEGILAVTPGMHDRDTTGVIVTSSVISSAKVGPNPFQSKTTISYFLEGKARITIKVTDLIGKDIIILLNNVPQDEGPHTIDFTVDELASNGLYNIVIIATPIDQDDGGGLNAQTQVIIPVQLIR